MLMDRSFIGLFFNGKGSFPSDDGECGIGGQKVHPIYNEFFQANVARRSHAFVSEHAPFIRRCCR